MCSYVNTCNAAGTVLYCDLAYVSFVVGSSWRDIFVESMLAFVATQRSTEMQLLPRKEGEQIQQLDISYDDEAVDSCSDGYDTSTELKIAIFFDLSKCQIKSFDRT